MGILLPSFFVLLFPTRIPLTFYQPILHGSCLLHTAPTLLHRRPRIPPGIAIGTLNIQDFRSFRMTQAIRTAERGFLEVMILTKTKI